MYSIGARTRLWAPKGAGIKSCLESRTLPIHLWTDTTVSRGHALCVRVLIFSGPTQSNKFCRTLVFIFLIKVTTYFTRPSPHHQIVAPHFLKPTMIDAFRATGDRDAFLGFRLDPLPLDLDGLFPFSLDDGHFKPDIQPPSFGKRKTESLADFSPDSSAFSPPFSTPSLSPCDSALHYFISESPVSPLPLLYRLHPNLAPSLSNSIVSNFQWTRRISPGIISRRPRSRRRPRTHSEQRCPFQSVPAVCDRRVRVVYATRHAHFPWLFWGPWRIVAFEEDSSEHPGLAFVKESEEDQATVSAFAFIENDAFVVV